MFKIQAILSPTVYQKHTLLYDKFDGFQYRKEYQKDERDVKLESNFLLFAAALSLISAKIHKRKEWKWMKEKQVGGLYCA
jgi:hypothetical protein